MNKHIPPSDAQSVYDRNEWYRVEYEKLMRLVKLALISLICCATATTAAFWLFWPAPTYFGVSPTGNVIPLQALDLPILTEEAVANWAAKAVGRVYSLNFVHYQDQIEEEIKPLFTTSGYDSFLGAINESRLLDDLKSRRGVLNAVVENVRHTKTPTLVRGVITWEVEVIVTVFINATDKTNTRTRLAIRLEIERVSNLLDPVNPIRIRKWLANYAP